MKSFLKVFFVFLMVSTTLLAKEKNVTTIVLETTKGNIEIELNEKIAPKATKNFLTLVKNHYYDGVVFHRVIKNFMIQTGDPTGTGAGGESSFGKPFEDEVTENLTFDGKGIVAMANRGPNTNGSQFFITTTKTPWLNMRHTIFGKVIKGYEVVEEIENVKTDTRDKPKEEQKIIKAYVK
jgi:peptidylprolyl isomerase